VADRLDADLRRRLELAQVSSPIPVAAGQLDLAQPERGKIARTA
jgi:hypothetical protein